MLVHQIEGRLFERQGKANTSFQRALPALRNTSTPIGVSSYRISEALPEPLRASLTTTEEIEKELGGD